MQLSTAGRYALRAMVDLAIHGQDGPIQCAEIAERQEVSDQYLSQLFLKLKRAGLVESVRGPGGGYVLAGDPGEITAGEVLRAVEEKLAPVFCVKEGKAEPCHRADGCPTHGLWARLGQAIHDVLDSVTLADLSRQAADSPPAQVVIPPLWGPDDVLPGRITPASTVVEEENTHGTHQD